MMRILVPTNFSETSQTVIRYLLPWMDVAQDELFLLHVVPEMLSRWSDVMDTMFITTTVHEDGYRALCDQAHWQLAHLVQPAWEGRAHPLVVVGRPAEEIVRVAREEQVDLIIMGTPKRSLWRQMVSGSIVARVIRWTSIPVITVANLDGAIIPPLLDERVARRKLLPSVGRSQSRSLGLTARDGG